MFEDRHFYIAKHCLGKTLLLVEDVTFGTTGNKDPDKGKARDVRNKKSQELVGTRSLAFVEGIQDDEYY